MNCKRVLLLFGVLLFAAAGAFAATSSTNHQVQLNVPEVVLIGLSPDASTITLNVVAPGTAGNPPTGQTNATKYLQYTAVNASGTNRNISVAWGGADAAPAGTSLRVQVTAITGGCGTPSVQRTISAVGQNIVTAIPSCVTGIGGTDGANLTYTLSVDTAASLLVGDNHLVTVTYTLSDAS
jgi:hypothetical protein